MTWEYINPHLKPSKIDLSLKINDIPLIKDKIYKLKILNSCDGEILYHFKPHEVIGKIIEVDYNRLTIVIDISKNYKSKFGKYPLKYIYSVEIMGENCDKFKEGFCNQTNQLCNNCISTKLLL